MNLMLIGDNLESLAKSIWEGNKNYTILTADDIYNAKFKSFIENVDNITITNSEQFKTKSINSFLDYMDKYEYIPIFVAKDKSSFERVMYTNVENIIKTSMLIVGEPKKEDKDEIITIAKGYINDLGLDDD